MKVAIAFVGFTTNTSVTYTTRDGTFPVTSATFRVSNLGSGEVAQWGVYSEEGKHDLISGVNLVAPELCGVLAPGQSKTVSVTTPWTIRGPWKAVFHFSKYSWRHKFHELPLWKQDMVRRFLPEKWLMAIPSETVSSDWIDG